MTTFNLSPRFPSATDFVSADMANLASHMGHCADSRSRFFVLHATLQATHGLVCSHIVTVSAAVTIGLGLVLFV
ncbi:MAG: hypothetical protein Q7T07_15060 [Burkholderiaceae bacterium]|nr:hypothetical protein [Burkholderiaceae bacterium]